MAKNKKNENAHDKMRQSSEDSQRASSRKRTAGKKLEADITDIHAAIEWFQAHQIQEESAYNTSVYFRRVLIQQANYDLAAATVQYEDQNHEMSKFDYNQKVNSAFNCIETALNTRFERDSNAVQESLIPLLYKDAQACREDTITHFENREDIINSPVFRATKGHNFLTFYQNKLDMVSLENKESAEKIFHNHILPYING